MRGAFLDKLFQQMEIDETIFFLTADMGINLVEKFEEKYPKRYLNVGIAEQNLIGVAAGLAESGMRPYVYTISNFLVHRCLEQIRNDIVIHNLPVVLVGTSTGYDNGPLGPTHHMLEDWGTISNFPGIRIYAPYNKKSAENILEKTYDAEGPSYVRIAKGEGVPNADGQKSNNINAKLVITYGSGAKAGVEYAEANKLNFIVIEELGMGSFTILDKSCSTFQEIIVVEDHFSNTGMYSYVTQWSNSRNLGIQVKSICPKSYSLNVGFEFKDFQLIFKP
jgi:transketolase